jgi:hypothetical protein
MLSDGLAQSQDIMGLPLSAPLTSYETIYSLPMLNIKDNKVRWVASIMAILMAPWRAI